MNTADYLQRLQDQLKGFPAEERAYLVEEIAAHIESGENDPELGPDDAKRAHRLASEMGSPEELGRRLRRVHRPERWLDYFMVAVPTVLLFPLLPLITNWIGGSNQLESMTASFLWVGVRLAILVHAGLVLASRWKCSPGVLIVWLDSTLLAIVSLLLSESRLPWAPGQQPLIGLPETLFWLVALGILLVWLVRVVRAQRSEPLLWVLALVPFLFATANYTAMLTLRFYQIEQLESVSLGIGWFGLYQISEFIWPALFFLPRQRDLRWAGLLIMPLTYSFYNLWPYRAYPLPLALYILPLALVLAAWAWDARGRLIPAQN